MKIIHIFNRFLITFSFSLLVFSLISCSSQHKLQRLENKHPELFGIKEKDSLNTRIIYRNHDTTFTIPGQNITLNDTIMIDKPCPLLYRRSYHTGNMTATLNFDSGKVSVTCHEDSLKQELHFRDVIIDSIKVHTRTGIATHDVYKTHWYDKLFRYWFLITASFFAGWAITYLARKRLRV